MFLLIEPSISKQQVAYNFPRIGDIVYPIFGVISPMSNKPNTDKLLETEYSSSSIETIKRILPKESANKDSPKKHSEGKVDKLGQTGNGGFASRVIKSNHKLLDKEGRASKNNDDLNKQSEADKLHLHKDLKIKNNERHTKSEKPKKPRVDEEIVRKPIAITHACGCIKTSEKLKELLKRFPAPPPPPSTPVSGRSPTTNCMQYTTDNLCSNVPCMFYPVKQELEIQESEKSVCDLAKKKIRKGTWRMISDLVQMLQVSVTALAMIVYYIVYVYMQFIYYILVSAMFFHNADGPMKVTIAVVTMTTIIVGFNLLLRMEKLVGMTINE